MNEFLPNNKDEEMFFARVNDLFDISSRKDVTKFSYFLDERQLYICELISKKYPCLNFSFYGGYDDAQRKMLGVFASYSSCGNEEFPITPVTFIYREQDKLTHRDFLGALMSLQIERNVIGDIIIEDGRAVAFLHSNIAQSVCGDIDKIGRVGVKTIIGFDNDFHYEQKYDTISGTVSSLRIDCIVSMFMKISREKAVSLIEGKLVAVNSLVCSKKDYEIKEKDKISVRGFGKIIIENIGGLTKKNRIHIDCKKFL